MFVSDGASGRTVVDLDDCADGKATLWWAKYPPDYDQNFWDVTDEWLLTFLSEPCSAAARPTRPDECPPTPATSGAQMLRSDQMPPPAAPTPRIDVAHKEKHPWQPICTATPLKRCTRSVAH